MLWNEYSQNCSMGRLTGTKWNKYVTSSLFATYSGSSSPAVIVPSEECQHLPLECWHDSQMYSDRCRWWLEGSALRSMEGQCQSALENWHRRSSWPGGIQPSNVLGLDKCKCLDFICAFRSSAGYNNLACLQGEKKDQGKAVPAVEGYERRHFYNHQSNPKQILKL